MKCLAVPLLFFIFVLLEMEETLNRLTKKGVSLANANYNIITNTPASKPPARPASKPPARPVSKPPARPVSKPPARAPTRQSARAPSRQSARTPSRILVRPASVRPPARQMSRLRAKTPAISLGSLSLDILGLVKDKMVELYNSKYKLVEYRLVDGIPEGKLLKTRLFQNHNALYYLSQKNENIDYYWLSSNTNPVAIELIKEALNRDPNISVYWAQLSENPSAAEILTNPKYRNKLKRGSLSKNTSPDVIKFLARPENHHYINWEILSANESAIALLEEEIKVRPENIYRQEVSRNSNAIRILREYPKKIFWDTLSSNTSSEAIYLLKTHIKDYPDDINWYALSANHNQAALELLQENPANIKWGELSENTSPIAIKLLEDRVKYENRLSDATYDSISVHNKINWFKVSRNPSAINLIIDRIKYENSSLTDVRYRMLKLEEKIAYYELSTNPSIFTATTPVASRRSSRKV